MLFYLPVFLDPVFCQALCEAPDRKEMWENLLKLWGMWRTVRSRRVMSKEEMQDGGRVPKETLGYVRWTPSRLLGAVVGSQETNRILFRGRCSLRELF